MSGNNPYSKYNKEHPKQLQRNLLADKRWWVFVLNNPESNDIPKGFKDVDTVTWQLEMGTRGIPHLQGVVQFLYPKSWHQVRQMCPRAWWHIMLGTKQEAIAYCRKEESRVSGPWSYIPVAQAVLDCLKGLSGSPCTQVVSSPGPHAPNSVPVVPLHAMPIHSPAPAVSSSVPTPTTD